MQQLSDRKDAAAGIQRGMADYAIRGILPPY